MFYLFLFGQKKFDVMSSETPLNILKIIQSNLIHCFLNHCFFRQQQLWILEESKLTLFLLIFSWSDFWRFIQTCKVSYVLFIFFLLYIQKAYIPLILKPNSFWIDGANDIWYENRTG